MIRKTIVYFEPGEDSTESLLACVDAALDEHGISKVVLASTRGGTATAAMDHVKGRDVRLVIVPHQFGFGPTGEQRFPSDLVARAEEEGHKVCFATMLFHQDKLWGTGTPQVVANFLRFFCQGVKVCVEILLMAANSGYVDPGEKVVVVAGTGRGADTALVMTAGTSMDPKQVHISEILCKPL